MKKLILSIMVLSIIGVWAQQPEKLTKKERPQFTPEQHAELRAKRMKLHLDLTDSQMKKIQALELKVAQEREKKMAERKAMKDAGVNKPSNDELFKMKSEMLDRQAAHKEAMKKILDEKQYEKWEGMKEKRHDKRGHMRDKSMQRGKRVERKEIKRAFPQDK
jgi:DNA-binding helix-hairpin-helix protein with protein kinase domain